MGGIPITVAAKAPTWSNNMSRRFSAGQLRNDVRNSLSPFPTSSGAGNRSSTMRRAPRVRYAAANKGQSAATTTVATAASGFITSGSAPMATSSAMGCSPDSALI
ncbi:hypothetical protein [Mycobacterium tuberculosis]|uniref:hypothetical protein n=1 Tax=Mycobacterium tuberculosis TaxID=1773 RepID=UPI00061C278E|nr:Uncharacterised protein [Mycobacterium tuberculosis]